MGLVWEKSKRSRSGATSEPFCATCVPSTCRSASCRRWVAEWLARVAVRRAWSTRAPPHRPAEGARLDPADVHEHVAQLLLRVGDAEQRALGALDDARVADLAAGLAVERRLVEHERGLLAGPQAADLLAVHEDGLDLAFRGLGVVAQEIGGARFSRTSNQTLRSPRRRALPGLARLLLLLLHGRVEGIGVDADAARLQRVLREVEREAVGVVELEGDIAGEHVAALVVRGGIGEQAQALLAGSCGSGFPPASASR